MFVDGFALRTGGLSLDSRSSINYHCGTNVSSGNDTYNVDEAGMAHGCEP